MWEAAADSGSAEIPVCTEGAALAVNLTWSYVRHLMENSLINGQEHNPHV